MREREREREREGEGRRDFEPGFNIWVLVQKKTKQKGRHQHIRHHKRGRDIAGTSKNTF